MHVAPTLVVAFEACEAVGWAVVTGAVTDTGALWAEAADIPLTPLVPAVGPVRQTGETGVGVVAGRPALMDLAEALSVASGGWRPDEVAVGRYGPDGGISAHRDNSHYTGFVAVLTITGQARFRVVGDREGSAVLADVVVGPGDLALLRGPRPGAEARPLHDVGPPLGEPTRTSLVLRRNDRGAGTGWE